MNYINFFFEETELFDFPEELIKNRIFNIIRDISKSLGEISIIFCSDEYLIKLNEKYLNHDYYTDIIAFNYGEDDSISGDLFISVDRVRENAVKFKVPFINEITRVVFHGVLHLTGFEDNNPEEKRIMRSREDHYLDGLDLNNFYR